MTYKKGKFKPTVEMMRKIIVGVEHDRYLAIVGTILAILFWVVFLLFCIFSFYVLMEVMG